MRFAARVEVRLRPGIADPEGATIERALPALGFDDIAALSIGRCFRFELDAHSAQGALERAQALATRLLANPVMEDAEVSVSALAGG